MAKQVITMRVLCIDVPTSAAGFEDIQFGLQDKDKQLLYGSTNTNDQKQYDFTLSVQQQRQTVLSAAYAANPLRFAQGEPVAKGAPAAVYINPPAVVANLS